jgi:hypothetical protein
MTGSFRPELVTWIKMFQRQANSQGMGPLATDGRVDPAVVGWGLRSGRTPGRRTIMALNQVLLNSDRNRFERLPTDRLMPGALGRSLATGSSIG